MDSPRIGTVGPELLKLELSSGGRLGFAGAVLGCDGCIYGVPADARQVLRFDPETQNSMLIGADLGGEEYKWSDGVLGRDGCIYGIPHDSARVLRFDPVAEEATLVGPYLGQGGGKWDGGVLGPDGCVYGVPFNSARVLRFDPSTQEVTLVGPDLGEGDEANPQGGGKWRGCVLGRDNCIYGIPGSSSHVLRFDPTTREASLVGPDLGEAGEPAGEEEDDDGASSSSRSSSSSSSSPSRAGSAAQAQSTHKWAGGVIGPDGCIYGLPFVAERLLRFDPLTQQATLVGGDLGQGGGKWSCGLVGADGFIYGIPYDAERVLRFDPKTQESALIGPDYGLFGDKWSSGVVGTNGCIYGVPYHAAQVLRIRGIVPPRSNGNRPDTAVAVPNGVPTSKAERALVAEALYKQAVELGVEGLLLVRLAAHAEERM